MSSIITREEVEKIARLSNIELSETEIINAQKHLEAVLSYAARVQDIAKDVDVALLKNSNIERDDTIQQCNPEPILAQAPEREGDFFVVPVIIENNQ
ncbi:MAG TPA: Asp-tRNA(Asn)/Glu-tRNA(Gln) amidotransferase subunit GatC [Candidatus Babeliales bacterium]|nr:Asp-tRNA(Asn)/Glu-tRNA(Gln) amidotransferase subunit GatC [Candidatus Babeliales bacterium]